MGSVFGDKVVASNVAFYRSNGRVCEQWLEGVRGRVFWTSVGAGGREEVVVRGQQFMAGMGDVKVSATNYPSRTR